MLLQTFKEEKSNFCRRGWSLVEWGGFLSVCLSIIMSIPAPLGWSSQSGLMSSQPAFPPGLASLVSQARDPASQAQSLASQDRGPAIQAQGLVSLIWGPASHVQAQASWARGSASQPEAQPFLPSQMNIQMYKWPFKHKCLNSYYLVMCTRLYASLCWMVGWSICLSIQNHFSFLGV